MKIIQVGLGGMGNAWLRAAATFEGVQYVGLVDIDPDIAERQAKTYGLAQSLIFPTLEDAIEETNPDGVILVTPPDTHRDLSITALEHGVPVLSEKPLADTPEAAEDIVAAAVKAHQLHMVAQNYRYRPATQTLRHVLSTSDLGEIGAVHIQFFRGPHFGGFRDVMDYPLIVDMAIHHFDLLRFFTGNTPDHVTGFSWNPPWSWFRGDASAALAFHFPNGAVATYSASWCSQAGDTPWNGNWRIECANGVVWLQEDQVTLAHTGSKPHNVELLPMLHTDQAYLLREFHRAVTEHITPPTISTDNIQSLRMVFSAIAACAPHR
ncbi:MAG: Gfo/Idh/MocA family oxidoreductase [Chloroflexi bacterium]|nr:Gfo/Idh/MocA family oxidoreductase [Chloroflexota bacterium]